MEKRIEDYLHFYLGQKVKVKKKFDKFHSTGTMVEVTRGSNHGDWIKVLFDDILTLTENDHTTTTSNMHFFFISEDSIKPILREPESIGDLEMIDLFKMCSLMDLSGCQFEDGLDENGHFFMNAESNGVVIDSIVYDYNIVKMMNNNQSFSPINPMSDVTLWLIKKGFDVFDLILSDLAIKK